MLIKLFIGVLLWSCSFSVFAVDSIIPLEEAPINLADQVSLQRGARTFVNYCAGCHTAKYVRYNTLAKGIGIVDENGKILTDVVQKYLIYGDNKITDTMTNAMRPEDGALWFGVNPPDLSLIARIRGADWLYTYLRSFYTDPKRPWGVNNLVYPDVAMPNVLLELQGEQILPDWAKGVQLTHDHLKLEKPGKLSAKEYNQLCADLVNFLVYISEPMALHRQYIGVWVLLFLSIFAILAYLLKREYWKDVK